MRRGGLFESVHIYICVSSKNRAVCCLSTRKSPEIALCFPGLYSRKALRDLEPVGRTSVHIICDTMITPLAFTLGPLHKQAIMHDRINSLRQFQTRENWAMNTLCTVLRGPCSHSTEDSSDLASSEEYKLRGRAVESYFVAIFER